MEWTQEGRLKFIKVGTDGNLDRYNKEYVLAYVKVGTIVPIWVAPQKLQLLSLYLGTRAFFIIIFTKEKGETYVFTKFSGDKSVQGI